MSIHSPRKIIERCYEEFVNKRRLSVADEIFGPDFKMFPDSPPPHGPEGVKRFVTWLCIESFPDLTVTLEDLVAERDTVAVRATLHATHTAQFGWFHDAGITAPTGKRFDMQEYVFWRVTDGKIIERRILLDRWGVAEHLGGFQSGDARLAD